MALNIFGKHRLPFGFSEAGHSGYVESVEGAPLPVVRLFGWYAGDTLPRFSLATSAGLLSPLTASRRRRADVQASGDCAFLFSGFRVDFLIPAGETPLRLLIEDRKYLDLPEGSGFGQLQPHYAAFFTQDKVMGRNSIYGSGPPTTVDIEFKEFAALSEGRVLDFGCGSGDLISYLRARGTDAVGLELDEPRITGVLQAQAREHVTLYPGGCPLPFTDGEFDCVVSTEVIEHIPEVQGYVQELRRILKPGGRLLITTPDITSIPSSFPAGCVPWHLLESTHLNFFTPQSVAALFAPAFEMQKLYALGESRVNGHYVPGSIGAVLTSRPTPAAG